MHRIEVRSWPQAQHRALADLDAGQALTVIAVATPETTLRDAGRELIRKALRAVLGGHLGCPPEAVPLRSAPGQAPDLAGLGIGLSVSHEAGLSLAAIHRRGAVGIDLMRVETLPDWEQLARDYLGCDARRRIAAAPEPQRPQAFGREWTRAEAGLKCLGLGLTEWSPGLDRRLRRCATAELALPAGLAGALAVLQPLGLVAHRSRRTDEVA